MSETIVTNSEPRTPKGPRPSLEDLQRQAEQAAAAYDWVEAERLYSQALQMADITPEVTASPCSSAGQPVTNIWPDIDAAICRRGSLRNPGGRNWRPS